MIPVLSREQIRAFDRHASEACAVPSVLLMENAGRAAAERIAERLGDASARVVILCGSGNNGGDGFVVARRLRVLGYSPRVFLAARAEKLGGDARRNYDAWVGIGGAVEELADEDAVGRVEERLESADLVVDGLLGTGLDREVAGRIRSLIERINRSGAVRVALDIPSGLDADTGRVLGVAVEADETVTFAHLKPGLLTSIGADHAGRVTVADIGVPSSLFEAVGHCARVVESRDVAELLAPRPLAAHKGSAGRVVAVAGSPGKTGAALLVAHGALRAGAGLVTIATFPDAADALDRRVLEEMTARIDPRDVKESLEGVLEGVDAVVIGPGLGMDDDARSVADHIVMHHDGAKVVDADALTHFVGRAEALKEARGTLILTPHPGELGRLIGTSAKDVEADRFGALEEAIEQTGAVVVLKGPRTLVGGPDVVPIVNRSGTPALATAGAGDVLSGICAAMLCTVGDPLLAAYCAAHLHGLAAEQWGRDTRADRGLLAHEIADALPAVLAGLATAWPVLPL